MLSFSAPELVLILIIALVVFGPGKLPEVGKALGKTVQEFKRATTDIEKDTVAPVANHAASQIPTEAHDKK